MSTLRELLAVAAPAKLAQANADALADALHDSEGAEAPLLVRLFTAVGTWIGAALVAFIFAALEIYEIVPLALILGVGLLAGATVLSRRPRRSLAMTQLIWAMALGAHGLVTGALFEIDLSESAMAATWLALALSTMFLIEVPSYALAAAVCAVGFATYLCSLLELPAYSLWVALPVAGVATAAWIKEVPWAQRLGRRWSALAHGLPIGVAGPLTIIGFEASGFDSTELVSTADRIGPTIATAAMLMLIAVVAWVAKREQGGALDRRAHALGGVAVLAVVAARHVPGLSLALLWLLVAHLRRSRGLQIIALVQLAGFLVFFYYQLETTLLLKSLWVASTGAVLLLGAWLTRPQIEAKPAHEPRRSRWLPALALVVLTIGLVAGPTIQKQRILARGQSVLLPLAPVDPRSLMQGDYMNLQYALEDEMFSALGGRHFDELGGLAPRHGLLVIALDDDDVGHFVRIDDGQALGPGELRLEYRLRNDWGASLRIGGESYFFEEGTAERYEAAQYGELVVAEDGESILVGLRDAERQPLGVRLHDS